MRFSRRNFIKSGLIFVPSALSAATTIIPGSMALRGGGLRGDRADPELSDWVTRVQGQGGSVSDDVRFAVGTFIRHAKAGGLWERFKRIGVYAGDSIAALQAPLLNLWGAATDDFGTFNSGDYDTTDGVLSTDVSQRIDTGIRLDNLGAGGSTQIDNLHVSVFAETPGASGKYAMGATGSGSNNPFGIRVDSSTAYFECSGSDVVSSSVDMTWGKLYTGTRTSTSIILLENGSELDSLGLPSSNTLPNNNLYIHTRNDNGSSADFFNARISFYSVGLAFTSGEVTNVVSPIVNELRTTLRAVGRR